MNPKLAISILCIVLNLFAKSQTSNPNNKITGTIVDKENGKPIPNCSIFLNNSSKGTTSSTEGNFQLSNINPGKYELIVSSIGYETFVYPFSANQLPLALNIQLKRKISDLSAITVEPFLKDGWEAWGQTFIDNFIGTSDFAKECNILNKEVVRFRYSQKEDELTATATEPILIENKALGYLIKFQMEYFSANFRTSKSLYSGYPLFSDISTESKVQQLSWVENRKKAYYGSLRHFVHCLYIGEIQKADQFNQEGFEVTQEIKLPNLEKQRVVEKYNYFKQSNDGNLPPDTLKYFKKILNQADSFKSNRVLTPPELISKNEDGSKTLFFTNTINITYRKRRKIDTEVQKSNIYLITPTPVEIEENGYYHSPLEIFTMGHWAKFQKLANLLPLDYWPEPN